MEASNSPEVVERLTVFVDRVLLFLDRLSEGPGVGIEEERTRLRIATAEQRVWTSLWR
jgi:hypothetical protein